MDSKKKSSNIALLVSFNLIIFLICSCSYAPRNLMVLTTEPMSGIFMAYSSIEQLYKSDDEIVIVIHWGRVSKPGNYDLRIEIDNLQEERIYSSKTESVSIRSNRYRYYKIRLDESTKDSLVDGGIYTCKLYINNELIKTKTGQYVAESIINDNVQSAVILPFLIKPAEGTIPSDTLSSSFAHPIYSEVKRIIPDTTPHYVAKQNIEKKSDIKCFIDQTCTDSIIDTFNQEVVIAGSIEVGRYVGDLNKLRLYVYSTESGVMKKFHTSMVATRRSYEEIFRDLINRMLFEEGFLDYIRDMS